MGGQPAEHLNAFHEMVNVNDTQKSHTQKIAAGLVARLLLLLLLLLLHL